MRAVFLLLGLVAATPALALTEDEVARSLEERWPVEVLRIEPQEVDGRSAFRATVMVRSGNFNDAMRVAKLLIDAESGQLIPQYLPARDRLQGTVFDPGREGLEGIWRP